MSTFPIVRFELEGARHAVHVALSERQLQLDADFRSALDAALSENNIGRVVKEAAAHEVKLELERAVREALREPRVAAAIRSAIVDALLPPAQAKP